MTESQNSSRKHFYHGRVVGWAFGLAIFATVVVDLLFDHRLSWWTLGKALGTTAVILAYFYFVRFPKLRRK